MANVTTREERIAALSRVTMPQGTGNKPPNGKAGSLCVMECVAWVAGETLSDMPTCASPASRGGEDRRDGRRRDRRWRVTNRFTTPPAPTCGGEGVLEVDDYDYSGAPAVLSRPCPGCADCERDFTIGDDEPAPMPPGEREWRQDMRRWAARFTAFGGGR